MEKTICRAVLIVVASAGLLAGCAQTAASSSNGELADLKRQLQRQREAVFALTERVAKLEDRREVEAGPGSVSPGALAVPELSVVKLRPKSLPAPNLETKVMVVEPDPQVVETFSSESVPSGKDDEADEDPAILELQYDEGVKALHTGNVEGGIRKLEAFASAHPKHPRADNAIYFVGAARLVQGDFNAAARAFSRVLEGFPASDSVPESMLKLAVCRRNAKRVAEARTLLSQLISQYPGTPAAKEAEGQMAALH